MASYLRKRAKRFVFELSSKAPPETRGGWSCKYSQTMAEEVDFSDLSLQELSLDPGLLMVNILLVFRVFGVQFLLVAFRLLLA